MELFKIKTLTPKEYILERQKQGLYLIKQDKSYLAFAKLFNNCEELREFSTKREAKKWLKKKRQEWRDNVWE